MTFSARPPAKLNLTLSVGERGRDGYHPLRSVFLRVGLTDRLSMDAAESAGGDSLRVSGLPGCETQGNIVLRGLALLRAQVRAALPPLAVELEKRIPVGGGLGGGSSDGAATLNLAAACWGVGIAADERLKLGAALGSDVPFFVADAPAALVEGRGERVEPLPGIAGEAGVLLVTPPLSVSTAAAYARHDELAAEQRASARLTDELVAALRHGLPAGELLTWTERLREANDLWPAALALVPALGALRDVLEVRTRRSWLLSGSGSSLFTFYASAREAAEAGAWLVSLEPEALGGALLHALELDGADPAWRHP